MVWNKCSHELTYFADGTLITVRALEECIKQNVQEFARVVFLDSFADFLPNYEDYKPLTNRPGYTQNTNKIVIYIWISTVFF